MMLFGIFMMQGGMPVNVSVDVNVAVAVSVTDFLYPPLTFTTTSTATARSMFLRVEGKGNFFSPWHPEHYQKFYKIFPSLAFKAFVFYRFCNFFVRMEMDILTLSRFQFALTTAFHYIFPPISIGLGVMLVVMEGMYLKTKNPVYEQMTKFWVKIFGLVFSMGVASGIVLEFQFGTNWSNYSRYVGDIFGSALAAEGIFAFFLESGFLAILLFGWNRVSPKMHFFSTVMVCLGSIFSAVWIVVANSWMQTPAGFHIPVGGNRAEITDFWAVVFNPSAMPRLSHVLGGALLAGAFFVLSVSAYYFLKKRHEAFARKSFEIALYVALVGVFVQLGTGHWSAVIVARHQPAKMAAAEGHYVSEGPAPLHLFGWVNEKEEKVTHGIAIPGMLSFLVHGDFQTPVTGLQAFHPNNRPARVNWIFQGYHAMVSLGVVMILLTLAGFFCLWRKTLEHHRWLLWIFVLAVLAPQLANQLGWFVAELGRQPWIVYGLLRTSQGISVSVTPQEVMTSLIMFSCVYILLFALFIFLLDHKIKTGPTDAILGQMKQTGTTEEEILGGQPRA